MKDDKRVLDFGVSERRCPTCNEPAHVTFMAPAFMQCELTENGDLGRILCMAVAKRVKVWLECDNKHTWSEWRDGEQLVGGDH